jgi:hypothetical protein
MESQPKADPTESSTQSERSTIEFPYVDLDNAAEVVRGVHEVGGTACDYEQLAAHMGQEAKGGGFRLRVNGTKTYGLVATERGGRITLTDLGHQIIDSTQEKAARAQAFLNVPLYKAVFDSFKGRPLPPQAGLERHMVQLGVGPKVADRARQVLLRAAKQAGYFDLAADRLTPPPVRAPERNSDTKPQGDGADAKRNGGGNGGGGGPSHPLIDGLLQTLPAPNSPWSSKDRFNWLNVANGIFKMIYQTQDGGDVKIEHQDMKQGS